MITFKRAEPEHEPIILSWLAEPHMIEFWDNTTEHKEDILNFIYGRPQTYFEGTTHYWVGYTPKNTPFAFILSDVLKPEDGDMPPIWKAYLSKTGATVALDFGIGNPEYIGKGLAAPTLEAFMTFYKSDVDPGADTFMIDPDAENPRALHVYKKAGFQEVGTYEPTQGAFIGSSSTLLIRKF